MPKNPNRVGTALFVALAAVIIAVASGFVSKATSTDYRWSRGQSLEPATEASSTIGSIDPVTPTLLSAHRPSRIEIRWACDLGNSLADTGRPVLLVATTVNSAAAGIRLEWVESSRYEISTQDRIIAQAPSRSEPGCVYRMNLDNSGSFTLNRGEEVVMNGPSDAPLVTSISTDIRPGSIGDSFLELEFRTTLHGPSHSLTRTSLRVLAALMIGLTIHMLLSLQGRHWRGDGIRSVANHAHWLIDGVVVISLLIWWLVGPVLFDDGWIAATVGNAGSDEVFTSFYDARNAVPPLGYLHLVTIKAVASLSPALLWLRLPSLVAGVLAWLLTRSAVGSIVRLTSHRSSAAVDLAAAAMFILSWVSWNNSVRAEPVIALLCALSLWASVRFATNANPRLLLIGSMAAVVAVSIHATGLIALAPLLVGLPAVARWARPRASESWLFITNVAFISTGVFVLALLSMGDLMFWLESRDLFRASGHALGLLDEPNRYAYLFADGPTTNSVRWMSVLLPFVAPCCFLVRRTRSIGAPADIPVIAFVLSVLLLGFGPSKWIWHFGVLAPVAAAAVAVELHRLQLDRENTAWVTPALGVTALGALAATTLSWRGGFNWQEVALIRWMDDQSPPQLLGRLLSNPLVLLAAVGVAVGARGLIQRRAAPEQVVRLSTRWVIPWLLPVTASISVLTAVSSFVIDGLVLAPGWSLAKQNLAFIPGSSCGLGDDMVVPKMNQSLLQLIEDREGPVLMAPQVAMYFPCLSQPVVEDGVSRLPTAILAVGVVPLGFGGSPYYYLSDIAHLERLSTVQTSTGRQLPIDVILVEPVLTVGG